MSQNILGTVFASLLNSLWQSAAIALLVWVALRFLPRMGVKINAATRCAAWWAVLAAILILPLAPPRAKVISQPMPEPSPVLATPLETTVVTATEVPPTLPPASSHTAGPLQITAGAGLLTALAIWAAFSLLRLAQMVRSYRYLRGITRRSHAVTAEWRVNFDYWVLACGIDRPIRLLVSNEIVSPMAVGFRKPAVIVPGTLLSEFSVAEMDHVILHELAHIARRDDWTNLFARVIGALLPIHPVAVWVVKRIEMDREIACDDWVVAVTGEARPYAASLTRLFELCSARRRQLLATGMADRASHLGERIEALLRSGRDFAPRVSLASLALGAAILLGLVLMGAQAPHWIAYAQEPAFVPQPPVAPVAPRPPVPLVAQVPPAAPAPPRPQTPPTAPQAPDAPIEELQRDIANAQQETQQILEELQRTQRQYREQSRKLNGNHPDQAALEAEIRAMEQQIRGREAEMQAAKAQVQAVEAGMRAQQQELRAQVRQRGSDSFLAALVAAGYGGIPVDEIIDLRNHGVSADFLRAIGQSGLGKVSTKELLAMAESGVRPDFFRAMRQAFPQVTVREIVEAAQSGVNLDDLRQAREFSPNLTLPQIIRLKQAGVI
ncbi:MAG TPA: M56 family metallopeptidase [Bryobacteraceae bacterium]|nr:M56 family metallopeptidase [Bryobacteraceae bacterium]